MRKVAILGFLAAALVLGSCKREQSDSSAKGNLGNSKFYDSLVDDRNVPYSAPQGQLSRRNMLVELGKKYPGRDCSAQCSSKNNFMDEACKLGLFGSIYLLTSLQEHTGRAQLTIWQSPNSALTVGPYAFMVEREAGISCKDSQYIEKYPTRQPRQGESAAPMQHVDVCEAWNSYFDVATGKAKLDHSETPFTIEQLTDGKNQVAKIQKALWVAHSKALLHSYWQYMDDLAYHPDGTIPADEYREWNGWNQIVAKIIPIGNFDSCADKAEGAAYQLMPNCIKGTKLQGDRLCEASTPVWWKSFSGAWSLGFRGALASFKTLNFIDSILAHQADFINQSGQYEYRAPISGIAEPINRKGS